MVKVAFNSQTENLSDVRYNICGAPRPNGRGVKGEAKSDGATPAGDGGEEGVKDGNLRELRLLLRP